jgi:FAD/FMN-containing dehydrogenase
MEEMPMGRAVMNARKSLSATPASEVQGLRSRLRGTTFAPGEAGYDEARKIWNAMIDRRPGLIARVAGAADVIQCVTFARAQEVPLAIRGGGHNIAGNAVCDEGLTIDFSALRSVRVDPPRRRAQVAPGATLGDFDRETHAFGLAAPVGVNSTTGIAGLSLGGGFGWTSRKLGLTCDHLVAADVVTANGELVRASAKENEDLFWGLRGGGGNFGVVTSFEFDLDPIPAQVLTGLIVFPHVQCKAVLERYRDFTASAPEELTVWVVLRQAPPLPFLPAEVHGKEVTVIAFCYLGNPDGGQRWVAPLRGLGKPVGEHVGSQPLTAWQTAFDPLLTPGARNYWKSHNFAELKDGLIDRLVEHSGRPPAPDCEIFLAHLGGRVNRVAAGETAYAHRDVSYIMNVHGRWSDPGMDEKGIAWSRGVFQATQPFATGGVYVNFLTQEESDRVQGAYGPNYDRMIRVKEKYDPTNLFRLNQNIRPTA